MPKYEGLDKTSSIYKSIEDTIKILKQEPKRGDQVQRRLIPKIYQKQYSITNLFRIELVDYWRLLYSLQKFEGINLGVLILDVLPHSEYDRLFGYD